MKLLLVCTSGGHFATMKQLRSFWSLHDRVWVTHRGEDTNALAETEKIHWLPYQAPRNVVSLIQNIPETYRILSSEKPDLIISTGASIALNFAFAAKSLGIRFVYIESISRSNDLSISGKLVYPMANEFYVQWPNLCKKYRRAIFMGYAS